MSRVLVVAAAQLGPIPRSQPREEAVARLVAMMEEARRMGADLVVYPEAALTAFFPHWWIEDEAELDSWFEREMPNAATRPLFEAARRLRVGFKLGYCELDFSTGRKRRFNTAILVDREGRIVGKYRKIHLPGTDRHRPEHPFQNLEKRYFDVGDLGFPVWETMGGRMGMLICNDRRWPESYRVMGLKGVEMILCGYNTPIHYVPDPSQDILQGFHNALVMQSGAYQNGTWVVGVAKAGVEEGVDSLGQSMIVAPSGQIVAQTLSTDDELITARCDLDWCRRYKETLFDFGRYRRPEVYGPITGQRGVTLD